LRPFIPDRSTALIWTNASLAAVSLLNEAIPLLAVEPLHGTLHHEILLTLCAYLRRVFQLRSKLSVFTSSFGEHHQSDAKAARPSLFGRSSIVVAVAAARPGTSQNTIRG
jgi:hypothetical protein